MKKWFISGDILANNLLIIKKEELGENFITLNELIKFSNEVERKLEKDFNIRAVTIFENLGDSEYTIKENNVIVLKQSVDYDKFRTSVRGPLNFELARCIIDIGKNYGKKPQKDIQK